MTFKRLIAKKHNYQAQDDLEKLIGYVVTRRSGQSLSQEQFHNIKRHFESLGGALEGLRKNHPEHWDKLFKSIKHVLRSSR